VRVAAVIGVDAPRACARFDAPLPAGLEPAMGLLLDYLDAIGVLAGGVAVEKLKAPLDDPEPRRTPRSRRQLPAGHPAGSARR
jgi:hypothetical protein